jgi:membrane protease YdiL (CAAX protease family)
MPDPVPDPPRFLRRAPEQRQMALILGLAFVLNSVPGTVLQSLDVRWGLILSEALFIAGPAVLALRWFYLDPGTALPLRSPGPRVLGAVFLGTVALNHLLNLEGAWQETFAPTPSWLRAFFEGQFVYRGPLDFAWLLCAFAFVPAVCEEVLFRGFLQAGLVQAFESAPKGIAVTALIFAAFHVDPWRFAGLFVLALFLGHLAHRSGSLVPPILAHALNNALSIVLATLTGTSTEAPGSAGSVVLALAALGAALLLLRRRAPVPTAPGSVL